MKSILSKNSLVFILFLIALQVFFVGKHFVNTENQVAESFSQKPNYTDESILKVPFVASAAEIAAVSLTRGPYLQLSTPNSIYVRWRTNQPSASKVRYGYSSGNYIFTAYNSSLVTEHVIRLTGLSSKTKYYYTIETNTQKLQGDASNFFITNPPVGSTTPVRIWAIGDFGNNSYQQKQVRNAYYNYTGGKYTNVWLWLGDNAYNSGADWEYQTKVFTNHYEKMLKQTVAWACAGNHDLISSKASSQTGPYYNILTLPKNGEAGGVPSGTEAYYSFNYANIHFISLESVTGYFRSPGSAMINWLKRDLAANRQRWTVVFWHTAPYAKGSHNSDTEIELIEMRKNVVPILENYKVDIVLAAHSHDYERSFLIRGHYGNESTFNSSMKINGGSGRSKNPYIKYAPQFLGTVYVVCGVSGQGSTQTKPGWPHNAMYYSSNNKFGSLVMDVNGDRLECKFLTSYNAIADYFTIVKQGSSGKNPLDENGSTISNLPLGTETVAYKNSILSDVILYPNPASNSFNIKYSVHSTTDLTMEIFNIQGEKIYSQNYTEMNGEYDQQIDMSEYAKGFYFIKLIAGKEKLTKKLVLE